MASRSFLLELDPERDDTPARLTALMRWERRSQMTDQTSILSIIVRLRDSERLSEVAGPPAGGEPFQSFALAPQDLVAPLGFFEIGQALILCPSVALLHLLVALGELEQIRMALTQPHPLALLLEEAEIAARA